MKLQNEHEITGFLNVEGVVKTIALERFDNGLALILEDFGGVTLERLFAKHRPSIREFLEYAIRITKALGQMYEVEDLACTDLIAS